MSMGPPGGDPQVERIARLVAAVASAWFFAAAAWEIAGPFGAGHVASSTAVAMAGENMWKWGILAPVTHYTAAAPALSEYYCHHPWGIFWVTALLVRVLGHHDFVCRLAPVVMSAATPPLLYALGRALWGPVAGAVSAVAFVVLPIALGFANFNALEVPVIFGVLLASWGLTRFLQTYRQRFLWTSWLGLGQALLSDWPAFVFAALLLLLLAVRLMPGFNGRYYARLSVRHAALWWAGAAAVSAGVALW